MAVHAFSSRVIDDLIEAGVDDIEHASGMDKDQICEAKNVGSQCLSPCFSVNCSRNFLSRRHANIRDIQQQ